MKYRISKNIEITEVEEENSVICFDVESGNSYILDEAGSSILRTVGYGMELWKAAETVAKGFDISASAIEADIAVFTEKLIESKIIEEAM